MSASLISFRLARAQRPHLHKDRNSNLHGTPYLLSYAPDRQLLDAANAALQNGESLDAESSALAGVTAQLQLVKDQYQLYLGETCVFYLTLSNQGSTAVTDITIKIEFVVQGGSSTVLYDSGPSPLPSLPVAARHDVIVNTDIKEQGAIQLVASAVFTDHSGERKYHVQFFKLTACSPLSVRTRVRCLPHIYTHDSSSSSGSSSSTDEHQAPPATRAFLEVSVENATQLPLVLHAVRLLPVAGIVAQQLSSCEQQQQQVAVGLARQQHGKPSSRNSSEVDNADSGDSDTQQLHDIADAPAGDKPQQHKEQQQLKALTNGFQQLHLEQQQQQQQPGNDLGPLLQAQQSDPLIIVPPSGSHNYLWQVDHYLPSQQSAAINGTSTSGSNNPGSSSSSSSSNLLGRLELHWSNSDGKTGRLLTQPLSGPSTGWHRDVLLQLIQLQPLAAAAAAAAGLAAVTVSDQTAAGNSTAAAGDGIVQPMLECLAVGELVCATLSLTAAAAVGPLLVLHTELTPTGPPAPTAGSSNRNSSSGGTAQQQQQQHDATASSSNSNQQRAPVSGPNSSSGGSSSDVKMHPDIAVQGSRAQRVAQLLPGQITQVQFVLLPLRPGWVRLPTFVVVSEADGRLLDSVHDVYLLVE